MRSRLTMPALARCQLRRGVLACAPFGSFGFVSCTSVARRRRGWHTALPVRVSFGRAFAVLPRLSRSCRSASVVMQRALSSQTPFLHAPTPSNVNHLTRRCSEPRDSATCVLCVFAIHPQRAARVAPVSRSLILCLVRPHIICAHPDFSSFAFPLSVSWWFEPNLQTT